MKRPIKIVNGWQILKVWPEKRYSPKYRHGNKIYYRGLAKCPTCESIVKKWIHNTSGKKCIFCRQKSWVPFGDVFKKYFSITRAQAKYRKLAFTVTLKYLDGLFKKQKRKCVYSGRPLTFASTVKNIKNQTASLDRINSKKGYIVGNVQWVHKDINKAKLLMSHKEFLSMCREIITYCKR